MKPEACPDSGVLKNFVRCAVSESEADSISHHIEVCPKCEETVVGLERNGDTVAQHIRQAVATPSFTQEPECRELMAAMLERTSLSEPGAVAAAGATAMVSPADLPVIRNLRDYQIVAKLGEGGMGAVYKAVHQRLKKTVALKVLSTGRIRDPQTVARFEREMSVLGQLNHPHIVQALDAGEQDGQHYLVMEYVEGSELSEIVKRRSPLSVADACRLISQAAVGLQYAHENGFVHRDIKPSNLMLARTGQRAGASQAVVKILDLGLARALEQPTPHAAPTPELTTAGQVMGTLEYMAPEQGGDSHQVDIRADIYSLGATLYKLLSGDSPFAEHNHKPIMQRLMAVAQTEPPPIRSKRADVPEKLAAVLHRMLAKQPDRRFATPQEVVEALEPFCAGADLAALLAPAGATRVLDAPSRSTPSVIVLNEKPGAGRHKKSLLAGVAALLLLAAVLVISTKNGKVEVSAPDGELPADVKVVVSRNGDEIEVLQSDNHWSAKLVNGEYQVALRGGDTKFEIKNSTLTINRMGRAIVTVELRKPVAEPVAAKTVPVNEPSSVLPPKPKSPDKPPVEVARVPLDVTKVAPIPAMVIPDQEKPFVVVNPAGELVGEYKFFTEALPLLEEGQILEVRGNGPFKLPQIVREKQSLHIRAGKGYRPQFVPGFKPSEIGHNHWVHLQDATLSIEGCDFTGIATNNFALFAGTGPQWSFQGCRLIAPVSHLGSILGFTGQRLAVRDSLLSCHSQYFSTQYGPKVQAEFHNNIVLNSSTFLGFYPGQGSSFTLKSNLFHNTSLCGMNEQHGNELGSMVAEDNLFVTPYSALVAAASTIPVRKLVSWTGSGNQVIQTLPGPLLDSPDNKVAAEPFPKTIDEWNAYWGNPGGLRPSEDVRFDWDLLAAKDWNASAGRFRDEITAARTKFPALPQLGPEMELVGAGPAYDRVRNAAAEKPLAERPDALEGGPFVILREDQPVAGFVSLAAALAETKTGDVIEVRSDGTFRSVQVQSPSDQRLTLRAAPGYAPVFSQLWLGDTGDWTLEGLRLRQELETHVPLLCAARRIANCTIEAGNGNGFAALYTPAGSKDSVEVVNCSLSQGMKFFGSKLHVENSVLPYVGFHEAGTFEAVRSCFWSHQTPRRGVSNSCVGQHAAGKLTIHVADCLFDTDFIMNIGEATWTGTRNLYRIHGRTWGMFLTAAGQGKHSGASLSEWRDTWKSDADSASDDSILLRPEVWRQR